LPFSDNQFDVVLSSESLEHVTEYRTAVNELIRVAGKAVIITVPHESSKTIEKNNSNNVSHTHIHSFNATSFDYLKQQGFKVIVRRCANPHLIIPAALVDAIPREHVKSWHHPPIFTAIYNVLVPLGKIMFGNSAAFLW